MNRNNVLTHYWTGIFVSLIGIFIFSLIPPTFAQDNTQSTTIEEDQALTEVTQPDFLTSGLYGGGLTFIGSDAYIQLQLQPDIPLGKIGIGLDLILLYNPYAEGDEPQILAEDGEMWDNPSTWLRLIRYVRYAHPYDPFPFSLRGIGLPNNRTRLNHVRLF